LIAIIFIGFIRQFIAYIDYYYCISPLHCSHWYLLLSLYTFIRHMITLYFIAIIISLYFHYIIDRLYYIIIFFFHYYIIFIHLLLSADTDSFSHYDCIFISSGFFHYLWLVAFRHNIFIDILHADIINAFAITLFSLILPLLAYFHIIDSYAISHWHFDTHWWW